MGRYKSAASNVVIIMDTETPKVDSAEHLRASLGKSIAVAELSSSVASLGSVWLVGRNPQIIKPAKQFLAKHIFYPAMAGNTPPECEQSKIDELIKKAEQKASVFLKGIIMVGASFASHIPVQMAMEGRHDMQEFKKVVIGKSVGIGGALGALSLINYLNPGSIERVEDAIGSSLFHCHQGKSEEACEADKELTKLMVIDVPSSIIAGLINYQLTKRL